MLVYWSFNFQFLNFSVLMSLNFELYWKTTTHNRFVKFYLPVRAHVLKWSVLVSVTSLMSIAVLLSVTALSQIN